MPEIHPTAIVHASARVGSDVSVGPYSIVEEHVQIGEGCRIGSHVTLGAHLQLGPRCDVYNYACLGTPSQDLKHKGQQSHAEIGSDCIIREFVTVNRATREGGVTRIGSGVVLMAYAHVAHECVLDDGALLVNAATLGGEVRIGRKAVVGGLTGVHQFCRVGDYAILGACSKLTQDLPPFMMADGHPARPYGPNKVGMRRSGFSAQDIQSVQRVFHVLYRRGGSLEENLEILAAEYAEDRIGARILEFCRTTVRGLAHPRDVSARLGEDPDCLPS